MKCPVCASDTSVMETRDKDGNISRRRVCKGPKPHRFNTHEVTEDELLSLRRLVFRYQRIRVFMREDLEFVASLAHDVLSDKSNG